MADKLIDARILARRQKDVEGFAAKYQDIVNQRTVRFGQEIGPIWHRTAQRIELRLQQTILELTAGKDVLPEWKLSGLRNQVKRLNTLYAEIRNMIGETEGPLTKSIGNKLTYTYTEAYYFNAFGLEQGAQVAIQAPILKYDQVMGVLNNPWLPDHKTYSDRIRANTAYLAAKMKQSIGRAVTEGWAWNETAQHIRNTAQEGYFNAVRLARTELTRAASQGATHLYMENADILDGKRWNATLDSRTAPKDAINDRKIYALDYDTPENPGVAGERIPNHPHCRCSYSPVLSALGVSDKERIARKGDSTKTWGENYYTKARTYEEYAKERGLPDLNERMVAENPRRYLRRGETMADWGKTAPAVKIVTAEKAVKTAAPAKVEPEVAPWVSDVKTAIGGGISTEAHARHVGGMVRQEVEKRLQAASKPFEINSKIDDVFLRMIGEEEGSAARKALEKELADLEKQLAYSKEGGRAKVVKDTLAEIRPMGNPNKKAKHSWAAGSNKEARETIERLHDHFPTDWLEKSHADTALKRLKAKKSDRGYYNERVRQKRRGTGKWVKLPTGGMDYLPTEHDIVAEISLSGYGTVGGYSGAQRCALHEMGHRFEDVIPGVKGLEWEFYQRRTAGEPLEWLGPGYKDYEKARFDKFVSPYMGKDYGNNPDSFYELLSMGIEGLYTGRYDVFTDPDFMDFILGVITGV